MSYDLTCSIAKYKLAAEWAIVLGEDVACLAAGFFVVHWTSRPPLKKYYVPVLRLPAFTSISPTNPMTAPAIWKPAPKMSPTRNSSNDGCMFIILLFYAGLIGIIGAKILAQGTCALPVPLVNTLTILSKLMVAVGLRTMRLRPTVNTLPGVPR